MQNEIIDESLAEQIIMHHCHQKYWQIKFEESQQKVIVECGLLLPNDQKDTQTIVGVEKKVSDLTEARRYMERCINIKLKKGYEFLLPQKPLQETKELFHVSSILDKRSNPNDQEILTKAGETSKKIHSSSTSSGLNLQLQSKTKVSQGTKKNCFIVIDDEDEEIEEIADGNSVFIGLEGSKKSHKKRTEDDGR